MDKIEFDVGDAMQRLTLVVVKPPFFSLRLKVAGWLVCLAAKLAGMNYAERIQYEGWTNDK